MSEKQLSEFSELVQPLYKWLQDNYCPHDSIIIEQGYAKVVSDQIGVPLEIRD